MTRPQRPCLDCGVPTRNPLGRCRPHQQAHDRARNQRRTQYHGAWARTSRRARAAEPWCHCELPGHGHDGRSCSRLDDLTLDHETGRVECRSCNSAHRANAEKIS